jgi:hypothetical protein
LTKQIWGTECVGPHILFPSDREIVFGFSGARKRCTFSGIVSGWDCQGNLAYLEKQVSWYYYYYQEFWLLPLCDFNTLRLPCEDPRWHLG